MIIRSVAETHTFYALPVPAPGQANNAAPAIGLTLFLFLTSLIIYTFLNFEAASVSDPARKMTRIQTTPQQ
jgi:hypothetical protein